MTGRLPKSPIYVLPHGIEVVGEYAPNPKCPYWRVRIRPHRFFQDAPVVSNGVYVRRNRVMLAAKLGRALLPSEHAHHDDEDRCNDAAGNVELLTAAEHNRHHKTGAKHSVEAKRRISAGLKQAIAEGRREPPPRQNWIGRKHSPESTQRMSESRKRLIAEGVIPKPVPPSGKGRTMSESAKGRIRQAKLKYWAEHKGASA